jgi:hypothetical protein
MPIIPPGRSWVRAAVDAVTAAPVTALTAAAQMLPLPQPLAAPADFVVVTGRDGVIEMLSEEMTLDAANQQRAKVIEQTQGEIAIKIMHKSVAARLRVGMLWGAILDVLESQLDRGYSILLEDRHKRVRF